MTDIGNKLKELSKAVPELYREVNSLDWSITELSEIGPEGIRKRLFEIFAIAAIRDWITGRGFRLSRDEYAEEWEWTAYDLRIPGNGPRIDRYGAIGNDELTVAIDCALAVAKEKTE